MTREDATSPGYPCRNPKPIPPGKWCFCGFAISVHRAPLPVARELAAAAAEPHHRRVAQAVGVLTVASDAELDSAIAHLQEERIRRRASLPAETVDALLREGRRG